MLAQTRPLIHETANAHLASCLDFTTRICAESGRTDNHSHGRNHMVAVYTTAIEIAPAGVDTSFLASVCLLHDVADPKCDPKGALKVSVVEFLQARHGCELGLHAWEIIKTASYSQEWALRAVDLLRLTARVETDPIPDGTAARGEYIKDLARKLKERAIDNKMVHNHRINWNQVLCRKCGGDHTLVRHLLSEADKLEAMGRAGMYRCMRYGFEYALTHGIAPTARFLIEHLLNHYEEKLAILYPHYFETPAGKAKAKLLFDEQERTIAELREKLQKILRAEETDAAVSQQLHELMLQFA